MSDNDIQTITLNNPEQAAVFTEDGRVFYDLGAMVDVLTGDILRKAGHGELSEAQQAYFAGMRDLTIAISDQREALSLKFGLNSGAITELFKDDK